MRTPRYPAQSLKTFLFSRQPTDFHFSAVHSASHSFIVSAVFHFCNSSAVHTTFISAIHSFFNPSAVHPSFVFNSSTNRFCDSSNICFCDSFAAHPAAGSLFD